MEPQHDTSHDQKEEKARRTPRVLVAEDNTVNQMVATRMLDKLGVQAEIAVNGREAVEEFKKSHYDLILMDCHMPEVDGFAATREIRDVEASRGGGHVPIVAVTASGMFEDRERCISAGMDDYTTKPLNLDQIRELLVHWIYDLPPGMRLVESSVEPLHETAIDPRALEGLRVREGDLVPNFLSGLIRQFLEEASSRLTAIHHAVEQTDLSALVLAAHSLKGSSAVMGARTMASLCAELEDHAKLKSMNETATLTAHLEYEFARVRQELEGQR